MIPKITPPPEKSREFGWNSMSPVKPFLVEGRKLIAPGLTAMVARQLFSRLSQLMTTINTNLANGLYDGDAQVKADAVTMLTELNAIAIVGKTAEKTYSDRTGAAISASAKTGTVLTIDQASNTVIMDQKDIDDLAAAVDTALGN